MTGVFLTALAVAAAAACVAVGVPLLLQEALAWQGGRTARVRVRPHTCTSACAAPPGGGSVAREVRLMQPTLWSEHGMRLSELRVTAGDGVQWLLPVPPTQLVRPGDRFHVTRDSGRTLLANCTTGCQMLLPRRLIRESSPIGSLAALPLVLVAPFALLLVAVGQLGRSVASKISTYSAATDTPVGADVHEMAGTGSQFVGSGLVWLFGAAAVACVLLVLFCSSRWPRPRILMPDGSLQPS